MEDEADERADERVVAALRIGERAEQRLLHGADDGAGDDARVEWLDLAARDALVEQRGEDVAIAALGGQPLGLDGGGDRLPPGRPGPRGAGERAARPRGRRGGPPGRPRGARASVGRAGGRRAPASRAGASRWGTGSA